MNKRQRKKALNKRLIKWNEIGLVRRLKDFCEKWATKGNRMDLITENLCEELKRRAELGVRKYGVTVLDRTDLTRRQWLQHLKEEMLDSIVYIEKLLQDESF